MNLPDENVTRFFIGKDYKEPKAFGIYKDENNNNFVVYKNKSDGTRAIRYEGKDEAYAVNELYIKLKEEIVNQKTHNLNINRQYINPSRNNLKVKHIFLVYVVAILIFVMSAFFIGRLTPKRGYYLYDNNYYYYQSGSWYGYNYSDRNWHRATVSKDLKDNYSDYYNSNYYHSNYNINSFENSNFYVEPSSSSSDSSWDSSSSWDSDSSWDSSSTDWDSDW